MKKGRIYQILEHLKRHTKPSPLPIIEKTRLEKVSICLTFPRRDQENSIVVLWVGAESSPLGFRSCTSLGEH